VKGYYSVLIPYVPRLFATEWHPTSDSGPFAVLSRGCFGSESEAIEWGRKHLAGNPYQVVYYPLPSIRVHNAGVKP
jgi:hypothetical protein